MPTATITPVLPSISNILPTPSNTPEATLLISWAIDPAGVYGDEVGGYPRWSEYTWALSPCEEACQNNSNCQGFAISKQKDYCQLFGSDGTNAGSDPAKPGTQIPMVTVVSLSTLATLRSIEPVMGANGGFWVTSITFVLMHGFAFYCNPIALIFFFVNALAFRLECGYLMLKSDSQWGALIIHVASDFYLFIAVLANA